VGIFFFPLFDFPGGNIVGQFGISLCYKFGPFYLEMQSERYV